MVKEEGHEADAEEAGFKTSAETTREEDEEGDLLKAQTKKSHYETLGVAPSASPEEIKRRFRIRADKAHPDKGGDHAEMSALNHAYEVLSDPSRRLLYDKTGQDTQQPIEQQVNNLIMMAFTDALNKDAPDILAHAKQGLENARNGLIKQKSEAIQQRDQMKARRDKITRKSGPNAFHMIIDQQLPLIEQAVAKFDQDLEVCKNAIKELKQYKSTEEIVKAQPMVLYVGAGYTAAAAGNW